MDPHQQRKNETPSPLKFPAKHQGSPQSDSLCIDPFLLQPYHCNTTYAGACLALQSKAQIGTRTEEPGIQNKTWEACNSSMPSDAPEQGKSKVNPHQQGKNETRSYVKFPAQASVMPSEQLALHRPFPPVAKSIVTQNLMEHALRCTVEEKEKIVRPGMQNSSWEVCSSGMPLIP